MDPATAPEWLLADRGGMTDARRARLAALRDKYPTRSHELRMYPSYRRADGYERITWRETRTEYRIAMLIYSWVPRNYRMFIGGVSGDGFTAREAYHDADRQRRIKRHYVPDLLRRLREATEGTQRLLLQAEVDNRELAEQVADWQARAALEAEAVRQRDIARAAADEAQQETIHTLNELDRADATIEMQGELITDLREGLEMVRTTLRDYGYTSGSLLERLEAMHRELVALRQQVAQSGAMSFRPVPPDAAA
jgi:hypothetical protein